MEITARPSTHINWKPAPKTLDRRCILMVVYGDQGSGKTSLALSTPGPTAFFSYLENDEGKLQRFSNDKEIVTFKFARSYSFKANDVVIAEATKLETEFRAAFNDAIGGIDKGGEYHQGWARTIIIDTVRGFRELQRNADFGGLDVKKRSTSYAGLNARFAQYIFRFKEEAERVNQTNLILVARTEPEWKRIGNDTMDSKTGRTLYSGHGTEEFDAEVRVRTHFDPDTKQFSAKLEKPFIDAQTVNTVYEGAMCNFAMIMDGQTGDITPWLE